MSTVNKDLAHIKSREFKHIYLIFGEERYLVKNVKKSLLSATVSQGDTMNFSSYFGKTIDMNEVIQNADTLPFFADYRVILLEDSNLFKAANDTFLQFLDRIPESTILVCVESAVDKRSKTYKKVKSIGYICEYNRMTTEELEQWAADKLTKAGKKIRKNTMTHFIRTVGNDMDNILSELEKLIAYCKDKEEVESADIDEICVTEINGKIFEMIDAMSSKNQKKALELYYDLIAVREAPMGILFMLTRQFNIMLQIKELQNKRQPLSQITDKLSMNPYVVKKTAAQCNNFSEKRLRNALENCLRLEESVKKGNMDEKMAVELIIVRYSKS